MDNDPPILSKRNIKSEYCIKTNKHHVQNRILQLKEVVEIVVVALLKVNFPQRQDYGNTMC